MPKGQNLSKYQQGIVNRYYQNKDTIMENKLAEIVSDLYLCTSEKQAEKLWERAALALKNKHVSPSRIDKLLADRDVKALAAMVHDLAAKTGRR